MKICMRCGTPQKDSNQTCVECGAVLGGPMDAEKAEQIQTMQKDQLDDIMEHPRYFDPYDLEYVGPIQKILVAIDILLILASLILLNFQTPLPVKTPACCGLTLVFCIVAAIDTAFPWLSFELELISVRMRFKVDDPEPSDSFVFMHRLIDLVLPILGIGCMLAAFLLEG